MKGGEGEMETVKGPDSLDERLTRLVATCQAPLLRLCFAYLHDEESAKDAVQETFLKAYRHFSSFNGGSSEETWLYRIAINTCKDMRRSSWFRHIDRSVSLDSIPEPTAAPEAGESELTLEIMKLPIKLREAALLCWFRGMSYKEAADVLGISFQAVSGRLNRARKKLRIHLEGSDTGDPAR